MAEKRKYEAPIAMPLGRMSRGEGGCGPGSGDATGCLDGNGYAATGCYDGPTEVSACGTGSSAGVTCIDGNSAVIGGCNNGSAAD